MSLYASCFWFVFERCFINTHIRTQCTKNASKHVKKTNTLGWSTTALKIFIHLTLKISTKEKQLYTYRNKKGILMGSCLWNDIIQGKSLLFISNISERRAHMVKKQYYENAVSERKNHCYLSFRNSKKCYNYCPTYLAGSWTLLSSD